jgi:argininosuccinate lyase
VTSVAFDPEYVSHVLHENFEEAKALFLSPLIAINYAHLVMLRARGIITAADARALRAALDSNSIAELETAPYDHACEDLFFHLERRIVIACGEEIAGRLRIARSRNDIDMTMFRMRQREFIAALAAAALDLRSALIDLAMQHRETIFAALTHTQPAQPTTVAHYLLAVNEQLERDHVRLRAAYSSTNRCPLGSCAITGTGFDIDRQLTSELLGFDEPTGNTYGSIATVDYLLESVGAAQVMLVGVGRVTQDLLLWCTREFGYMRLADGLVQGSSIMPQKRNPVALEHARSITSKALGEAVAITTAVHNTPFGDIVDTEDDLQPLVAAMFRDAQRAVALLAVSIRGAELNVDRMLARASEGGTTLTELADRLVRDQNVSFTMAHSIAAGLLSGLVPPTSLGYTDEELTRILGARNFVEARRTAGGPAPSETSRALEAARALLQRDRAWLDAAQKQVEDAATRRRERAQAL